MEEEEDDTYKETDEEISEKLIKNFIDMQIIPEDDETEQVWNESFDDEVVVSKSITVGIAVNYTSPIEHEIGMHDWKDGKPSDYRIFNDKLWIHMLRFIHLRLTAARGTGCLINIRTMSRWITEQSNIKSMWAVEKAAMDVFMERFGVPSDVDQEPANRGWKPIRGTMEFWGTLGGRGAEGKKRLARLYQVIEPKKLMKYIEGEINLDEYR